MADNQDKSENSPPIDPRRRKRLLTQLAIFFLAVGFIYSLYWIFAGRFHEETDDAYVSGNLIRIMPQTSGHVTAIYADVTDLVQKGEVVVTLDKADAEVALRNAEALLALTVRQVNNLYHNVDVLKATVAERENTLTKAKDDYARREGLVVNKVISREELQHSKIDLDNAVAALYSAKQQLASAVSLVANSDLYHHPQVQQAAAQVRDAYLALQRTSIYAPETGYVAKRSVDVGEQVNQNSVLMIIVPLDQVWVDANYKESQIKNFRIGQPVELYSDAYGSDIKYKGRVVGLNPGSGNAFDLLPPQNATGNWIKIVQRLPVRIAIDPEQLKKYPLRVGLSMIVNINTRDRSGHVLTKVTSNKAIYKAINYNSDLKNAEQLITQILQQNASNVSYPASQ